MATDLLGHLVANFSSKEPSFALNNLDENLTIKISASNSEGNSTVLTLATGQKPEQRDLPTSIPSLSVGPLLGGIIGVCIILILLLVLLLVFNLCKAKSSLSSSSLKKAEAKMPELKEGAQIVNDIRTPDLIPTHQDFEEEEDDPDRDTEEEEDDIYSVVRPQRPCSRPPPTQTPVHPASCRGHGHLSHHPHHHHLSSFYPNAAHSPIGPNSHSTPYYSTTTFFPRAALHNDIFSNSGEMSPFANYLSVHASNLNQPTYNSSLDRSNISSTSFSNRLSFSDESTHMLPSNPAPVVPQPRKPSLNDVITLPHLESAV